MAGLQEKLAFLPDYGFKKPEEVKTGKPEEGEGGKKEEESWPDVSAGKSLAGILGAALTLFLAGGIGFGLRRYYSHSKGIGQTPSL